MWYLGSLDNTSGLAILDKHMTYTAQKRMMMAMMMNTLLKG